MRKSRKCKWHNCAAEFIPQHNRQEYCCTAHRVKMSEWKKMYGARIVTLLLETPITDLNKKIRIERKRLLDEIKKQTDKH